MENGLGTVISATLRPKDLIPAFIAEARARGIAESELESIARRMKDPDYYSLSDDVYWDLETLYDILNDVAPEGTYFGANEGDGSDFGFWPLPAEED